MTERRTIKCRLCGKIFPDDEMSEEHYPAHSTGNDDIVGFNITKTFDMFASGQILNEINGRMAKGLTYEGAAYDLFDKELAESLYPRGRTARTLCRSCNTFLGKYDEAYLKFYNCDGDPKTVKGFQDITKLRIIKSIYGKFLSVPEAAKEEFDFTEFIRREEYKEYQGVWNLYCIKRDYSTDMMGLPDIRTGALEFEEGTVYELSDDKFIFNLMNFPKHDCFEMTNVFDLISKRYNLTVGSGESGGYHAQLLISNVLVEK